jgi:hypothetical protein
MTSIERLDASGPTRAATGITHYVFDATGWKAFGANDEEIVTSVVSTEERGKGLILFNIHDRHIEITYSIENDGKTVTVSAVVDGLPSNVAFSKDGGMTGAGFGKTADPAIHEIFHLIGDDLKAGGRKPNRTSRRYVSDAWCGAMDAAANGAARAGEVLATMILADTMDFWC